MEHLQRLSYLALPPVQKLMVDYLAHSMYKSLDEVDWAPVAGQLYLQVKDFCEMVESFGEETLGAIWLLAVNRRIESLSASKPLQVSGESRIRNKALIALEGMLDKGLVRDVGELLSIAAAIQRNDRENQNNQNRPGVVINNFGASANPVVFGAGQTLPSGDEVMFLDLSPHTLTALKNPPNKEATQPRTIDSGMLGVDDLPLVLNQITNKTE